MAALVFILVVIAGGMIALSSFAFLVNDDSNITPTLSTKPVPIYNEGIPAQVGYTSYLVQGSRWTEKLSDNPIYNVTPEQNFALSPLH